MVEQLDEHPLGPFVVFGVGGTHLAVPVEREADLVKLLTVAGNILAGGHSRVLAGLDGVLLGGQTKSVVAHRVQHVEALLPFVAGVDVGSDVAKGVTDVQSRTRRIGEHIQNIELRFAGILGHMVDILLAPYLLPAFLNFSKIVIHNIL